MFPDDLHSFCPTPAPDQIEGAFLAQLEPGETVDNLSPARFATIAVRAAILSELGIDWGAEMGNARRLGADRVKDLALRLATGEIDAVVTLRELSDREAELTCRVGGIYLTELVRLIELADAIPSVPDLSAPLTTPPNSEG